MIEYKLETSAPGAAGAAGNVSIIGIGGAGANVLDHIAMEGMDGVDLISMNCDVRALTSSMAGRKVQLGKSVTQGLGCGGDPELGQESAVGSLAEVREALTGRKMLFLCVGLGGGTGSGAAPVIARLARETGAFVIVFATMPFVFEGKRRMVQAQAALEELRRYANALVTFENDKMGEMVLPKKGVNEAFEVANKMICQSVRAVSTVATQPGLIRIGMDDLITALRNADSRCIFGFGQARGETRATEALAAALKSPLLDRANLHDKARNVLVHICGGASLTLFEIETLMKELSSHVSPDAQILFGAASDAKLGDQLSVTIISSIGREKAAPVEAKAEPAVVTPAPAQPVRPQVVTMPILSPFTQSVPVVSVQPKARPVGPAGELAAAGSATITIATSSVPVLQLTAALGAAEVMAKPQAKAHAPVKARTAAEEPDLFAGPAVEEVAAEVRGEIIEELPAVAAALAAVAEPVVLEEPVMEVPAVVAEEEIAIVEEEPAMEELEEIAATVEALEVEAPAIHAETEMDAPAVIEPVIAEEETFVEEVEEEIAAAEEEQIIAEQIIAAEEIVAAEEEIVVAEEVTAGEEEIVVAEEVTAEEELILEEEEPAAPQPHPAFNSAPAVMKPMDVQPPAPAAAPAPASKKFDLREILQRQRQSRLGHYGPRPAAAPQPAPQPPQRPVAPQPQRPAAQQPTPRPALPVRPMADRVPNPERLSPIRPIQPATPSQRPVTHASPFSPSRQPVAARASYAAEAEPAARQATFDERLTPASRGRFDKAEPTVEEGEDLDIPTFLRKKR